MQGDQGKGYIHRHTVGKLIASQVISNSEIPSKCTFELVAQDSQKKGQLMDPSSANINWKQLNQDDQKSVCLVDHEAGRVRTKRKLICGGFLFFATIVGIVLICVL